MPERQAMRQEAAHDVTSDELPERLRQAMEAGEVTQEQVDEMMKQRQAVQPPTQGQVPTAMLEDFQLREGLTVTVTITVDEVNDVLLIPNSAITSQGGQTYVQVVLPDGTLEERAIRAGISDYQFTEVTSGLGEGEQVAVPQGTTTATTQQGARRGPMPFLGPPPH
jgi:multidrug efflux pump subunit AcrA (membrane-fusion protein)